MRQTRFPVFFVAGNRVLPRILPQPARGAVVHGSDWAAPAVCSMGHCYFHLCPLRRVILCLWKAHPETRPGIVPRHDPGFGGSILPLLTSRPLGYLDADRKSTRLNSSHLGISYAVFCLKKKKKE